jgi:hypothetical protein
MNPRKLTVPQTYAPAAYAFSSTSGSGSKKGKSNAMKRQVQFVNASEARSEFLTFTNAVLSEDGWMHLAPVGDFEGIA